jgi:pyrroline-5-carboxylate reductase
VTTLLLVGCGKMGGALLSGWLDRGLDATGVTVVEPNAAAVTWAANRGVSVVSSADEVENGFSPDVIVLAVKPQMMDGVVPDYADFAGSGGVFLSIAAGRTVGYFEGLLGPVAPIIRSMPNTPASVRRGISVACANGHVTDDQKRLCQDLLEAVGEVAWVDDEAQMDAVTAVSGSGPAYVFLLVEAMSHAGIEVGLPSDLAVRLARATVAGAGELLFQSEEPAEQLRQNVTSPGGTTAEALGVLMGSDGWQTIVDKAIAAAARRSRELAG